jgi:hypothetical protein
MQFNLTSVVYGVFTEIIMIGFSLSFWLPGNFNTGRALLNFLLWLFAIDIKYDPDQRSLMLVARLTGVELTVRIAGVDRELAPTIHDENRVDGHQKAAEEFIENIKKGAESSQKYAESSQNTDKSTKIRVRAVDNDGNVRASTETHENGGKGGPVTDAPKWARELMRKGASLILMNRNIVDEQEYSFRLPIPASALALEIGSVAVFGTEDNHILCKVTGYREEEDDGRLYYYTKTKL